MDDWPLDPNNKHPLRCPRLAPGERALIFGRTILDCDRQRRNHGLSRQQCVMVSHAGDRVPRWSDDSFAWSNISKAYFNVFFGYPIWWPNPDEALLLARRAPASETAR